MPTLGERLRIARVAKGFTPQQAELEIRLRAVLIQYLEDDNLAKLPPPPFTRGLLRNYARYLGLDSDQIIQEYDVLTGLAKPDETVSIPLPSPPASTMLPPEAIEPVSELPEPFAGLRLPSPPLSELESLPAAPDSSAVPVVPQRDVLVPPSSPDTTLEPAFGYPQTGVPVPALAPGEVKGSARRTFPVSAEILAIGIILLVILLLSYTAIGRFLGTGTGAAGGSTQAAAQATGTATVTLTPSAEGPTAIRTFVVTSTVLQPNSTVAPPLNPIATTIALPAETIGMTLTVEVQSAISIWVMADNREVFKGDLTSGTQTWVARGRLYVQVRNIPNARVTLSGKPVQAATFAERSLLERAWILNPRGTPIPVVPDASFRTPGPTPTMTDTPLPPASRTPLPSRPPLVTPTVTPIG